MKRFAVIATAGDDSYLVCDTKGGVFKVICDCVGWNKHKHATMIADALNAHHNVIYDTFMPRRADG